MFWRMSLILMICLLPVSAQDEPDDMRFFLTFVPNVQFAPVYVAIERGYFEEAGLNLIIEHGDEPVGVDLIAADEVKFGIISGEQVLMARAGGRPVVYVYEWFQQYPVGIAVPNTSGDINSVEELVGLKVGIPGRFGASYSGLTALLGAYDMTEADINLELIGFAAPDVMCAGGVEAAVVYRNNEPLQITQRAHAGECGDIEAVRVFPVADDADMVSNGLVTNEQTIKNNPDLVTVVVAAYDAGLRDVLNNPAEAYLIALDYVENLPINDDFRAALEESAASQAEFLATQPDHDAILESRGTIASEFQDRFEPDMLIQWQVLLASLDLWDSEQLGYSELGSWELTLDIIDTMGMLPGDVDVTEAFTNAFLPEVE